MTATYGDQLLAEAIDAYRRYDEVSDPDDVDNVEANEAGSVIGALLCLIREELGHDIHAASKPPANNSHTSGGWELHPNHVTTASNVRPFERAEWIEHVRDIYTHLTPSQVRQVVTIVEHELNANAATPGYRGVNVTKIAARVQLGEVTV